MKKTQALALILSTALCCLSLAQAASSSRYNSHNNLRVVLDTSSPKKDARLMIKRRNSGDSLEFQAMIDKLQHQAKYMADKIWKEANGVVEKVEEQAKALAEHFQHYSKKEVGMYAALTVALTIALKTLVFTKGSLRYLDIDLLSYILNSPAARTHYASVEPVLEFRKPNKRLSVKVSPTIVSTDRATYRRTVPKVPRHVPPHKVYPPTPPARPAQVVVDTVSALYQQSAEVVPAAHNAVVRTMTPAMRQRLRARRIRGGELPRGLIGRLRVGFYFLTWYALNVMYNIVNKKVLNVLPAPLMVGSFQFLVGGLYCALVWLLRLRPRPTLAPAGQRAVTTVGLYHCLGQLASIVSLGAGPVSFTHIVKAMEPFFSAIVSGVYFAKWMPLPVYATLVPVVGGVGYACMNELNFSWLAFGAAMASNLLFALRAVMSKLALQSGKQAGTNLTPPNMFGLVTWAAFLISIPIALVGEGNVFVGLWEQAMEAVTSKKQFLRSLVLSGLLHYLNNEVMYMALGSVHPVTLAVGNTMKRVFILVAAVMVFRNPITVQAGIGSGVGIAGVLLYSLTKQYYESQEIANVRSKWRKNVKTVKTAVGKKPNVNKVKVPMRKRV